jgi:murein L,D-transpeptidase YafK
VDRARPGRSGNMGGDIYIHGGCKSIGCLAMTDEGIEELYWMAVEVRAAGQTRIPVHIFPARLDDVGFTRLVKSFSNQPQLGVFWANLKPGFDYFEAHRRLPLVVAGADGKYRFSGLADATGEVKNDPGAVGAQPKPGKPAAGVGTGNTSR